MEQEPNNPEKLNISEIATSRYTKLAGDDFDMRPDGCRLTAAGREKYLESCAHRMLPRLEKRLRPLLAGITAALADPGKTPEFGTILPER